MQKLRVFIGLCGRVPDGFESSGRGESRWAQSLARCLSEAGHEVHMAPDAEECGWGKCKKPDNVFMYQAHQKRLLNDIHFDIAIYSSWQTPREEALYIHADKYVWGVMGWKQEIMKDGFFFENEYVARWFRADVPEIPYPINFKDRCFLLAQPFGKELGVSKFSNKRIGWVAKEAFLSSTRMDLSIASKRHIYAIVDACKQTGASLAIFSCHELDPRTNPRIVEMGIYDKIMEVPNVTMYPTLSFKEYQRELQKCSITVPVSFAGSIQESIINGIIPFMYKDSMFSNHPWIKGVCEDLTKNRVSRAQSPEDEKDLLSQSEISDILIALLSDEYFFDGYLSRLRPMVVDNLDQHVLKQLESIMNHKINAGSLEASFIIVLGIILDRFGSPGP